MKKGVYILPNSITLGNLFCGFYAIISILKGAYPNAAIAMLIAGILDGMDGWVARMTHSTSRFGIEFDSLADVISFGIAPALLVYTWALSPLGRFGWAAAFLFAACGTLRLARYNVQFNNSESKHFTGLPIPGAAGMIASLVIVCSHFNVTIPSPTLILLLTYMLAFLMVSNLKYRSIKEVHLKKPRPFSMLVAAALLLFLLASEPQVILFSLFCIYVLSGIIEYVFIQHGFALLHKHSKSKRIKESKLMDS